MAHKKGVGSSRNGRDSNPQFLGVKAYGNEYVTAGSIIVRQHGTRIHPGVCVQRARDDSLFALRAGSVPSQRWGRDRERAAGPDARRLPPGTACRPARARAMCWAQSWPASRWSERGEKAAPTTATPMPSAALATSISGPR